MGKIGDLFVRLGLKSDDYKKGMKEAKKETTSFSQGLGKMKAGALAIWAAIGTAAVSFGKQLIGATNRMGDAWDMFVAKSTAGWRTFMQALSAWDWENFIGRFKEARQAAEELQSALDMSYEVSNSIKLQKAAMADELAALEILARNVSKPYEERAKAAQEYLNKVKPIYDQELDLANRLLDAQESRWLAGTGLQDNKQTRKDLAQFLVDYGKVTENKEVLDALAFMRDYQSEKGIRKRNRMSFDKQVDLADKYIESKAIVSEFEKSHGYGTSMLGLSQAYENLRADADTQPLIDALIAAWNAEAAFDRETKKMQQALNQASVQLDKEDGVDVEFEIAPSVDLEQLHAGIEAGIKDVRDAADSLDNIDIKIPKVDTSALDDIEIEFPEVDTSALDAAYDELNELYNAMRNTTLSPADRKAAAERYRALLEPLVQEEIRIYGEMLDNASDAWQIGQGLSRKYSTDEMREFFANYGTDTEGMTAKYAELASVYENREGDELNQVILDILTRLGQADAQMSNINKVFPNTQSALDKALVGFDEAFVEKLYADLEAGIKDVNNAVDDLEDVDIEFSEIDLSALDKAEEELQQFVEEWRREQDAIAQLNGMLEDSIVSSIGGATQAFTDALFGLEGADAKGILAALMQPFADTATQLGTMLIAQGIAVEAFKSSLEKLQGVPAIAAGAALLAIGAAMRSGIKALAGGYAGGSVGAGTSSSYGGNSYGSEESVNYDSTLTIYVEGKVSGSDILIAGQNQQNKWNR